MSENTSIQVYSKITKTSFQSQVNCILKELIKCIGTVVRCRLGVSRSVMTVLINSHRRETLQGTLLTKLMIFQIFEYFYVKISHSDTYILFVCTFNKIFQNKCAKNKTKLEISYRIHFKMPSATGIVRMNNLLSYLISLSKTDQVKT